MFYGMNQNEGPVKRDVHQLRDDMSQAAADVKAEVLRATHDALGMAQEKVGELQDMASQGGKRVKEYTQENTIAALGIAALAGVVVGFLLSRHRR